MPNSQGLNSLATIIKRLEAATSRLEDLAITQSSSAQLQGNSTVAPGPAAAAAAPHHVAAPVEVAPPPPEDPPSVQAWDADVASKLKVYLDLSAALDPLLKTQSESVSELFTLQRALIVQATVCTKPDDASFQKLLAPFSKAIATVGEIKDANRSNRVVFNHLSTVADGIPAVGWVTVSPKPGPYIAEIKNSSQFYANRVIKEFKDKDAKHVEWARNFDSLLESLRKYVVEHHTTGLVWNPKGQNPATYSSAAAAGGAPPPPPPPPPPAPAPPAAAPAPAAASGPAAVLADLNKGADVTKGLRKVAPEQMTHKNPELRASGGVPAKSPTPASPIGGKKPIRPTKPSALAGKKPSKLALEGKVWVVEYFEGEKSLVVENTEISQMVNLYGCKNTTVLIKGKVNAVTMVNCSKTSVLVDSVIASISVTSSPSFALQITGKAPTIQLDSTDSGQIYLSKDCLDVEITSAKCSAINVSLPVEGEEEGVFVERAVPEMLRTVIQGGKLVSSIVEHSG